MSTASDHHDEDRKPLLQAYMIQRRILLGCVGLIFVALVFWIVAISTDHWYLVSANGGSHYIYESRRFFRSSHTGIWKSCRYASIPTPLPDGLAVRWLPQRTSNTLPLIEKLANEAFVKEFLDISLPPLNETKEIDDNFKKKMFALFATNDTSFVQLKTVYHNVSNTTFPPPVNSTSPLPALNKTAVAVTVGKALVPLTINGTQFHYIIPVMLQNALFDKWNESVSLILPALSSYARELGISGRFSKSFTLYYIQPPPPPKKSGKQNGYAYENRRICINIEIFPTSNEAIMKSETAMQILDYQRTAASFACIAILIMIMAIAFSVYTFLNPRYTFKRLAGGIHLISGLCCCVVIQVTIASLDLLKKIPYNYPVGSTNHYGYGIYIAWIVFAANLLACLLFLIYSGKKKGAKAPTEELAMADEPTIMGR